MFGSPVAGRSTIVEKTVANKNPELSQDKSIKKQKPAAAEVDAGF
jgi:hypothetical protein